MSENVPTLANPEAEEAVLGSLLIDQDAFLEVVGILKPDDFYRERNGWIYRTIAEMNERREPVDFVSLCDELERQTHGEGDLLRAVGGAAYITELINNTPSAMHAQHYAERVLDMSLRRDMIERAGKLAAKAWDFKTSPREAISEHISEMTGFSFNDRTEPSEVKDSIGQLLDLVQNGGIPSVSTGYRELDRILRGGFKPGKLTVFAARPGVGKTAAMLNTMWRGAKEPLRAPAAFFSCEMSKLELTGRLMSISGGVPNDVFNSPEIAASLKDSDWEAMMQIASELSSAPMILDDTPGIFLGDLYAKLRRLKARYGIRVAYIDYLQLVRVSESFQNRNLEVGHISSSLKRFALELEIQIVAASQLNRAVEGRTDNRPVLSDLRESGSIEQDADVVIFLYREDLVKPTTTRQNIVDAIVAKNRAGTIETAEMYYRGPTLTFENIEQAQVADGVPSNQATTDTYTAASGADQWDQSDLDLDALVTG